MLNGTHSHKLPFESPSPLYATTRHQLCHISIVYCHLRGMAHHSGLYVLEISIGWNGGRILNPIRPIFSVFRPPHMAFGHRNDGLNSILTFLFKTNNYWSIIGFHVRFWVNSAMGLHGWSLSKGFKVVRMSICQTNIFVFECVLKIELTNRSNRFYSPFEYNIYVVWWP